MPGENGSNYNFCTILATATISQLPRVHKCPAACKVLVLHGESAPRSTGCRRGSERERERGGAKQRVAEMGFVNGKIKQAERGSRLVMDRYLPFPSPPPSYSLFTREENGYPRENPPASGVVRHDSHLRKSGVARPGIEPGSPWWDLERASQKQSSDTHKTPYDRVKLCRERKIYIKASERVNVDVFTQHKRPRGGVVVRPLTSHQGDPSSILGQDFRINGNRGGRCRRWAVLCFAFRRCSILTSLYPHRWMFRAAQISLLLPRKKSDKKSASVDNRGEDRLLPLHQVLPPRIIVEKIGYCLSISYYLRG
ncbi:hypothetical protein PR048_029663 [Dryococelus australis]|uniref:Uncharacterized protein n=1 Tax=Dryococelus australis TaxID=614101 RepID=A0ABQ9GE06_9NEOP|nr:hypothetical protein PR048_029663 [Dryococelus australis]